MKVIVPIGGGEISLRSTIEIDKYIVSLVNKETKKVLFIPTASGDMPSYIERFTNLYKELGCEVDSLLLSKTENDNLIRSKIFSSDIIYIGGGNTARMMRSDQDWFEKRTKPVDHPFIIETVGQRDEISVGVMGFPELATKEKGEKVCNEIVDGLIKYVDKLEEHRKNK